ncbi:hypothetical protein LTR06_011333 [Exophiala xenobiotica]|nr:hypothetical protein LTR06_011333 [Exophiala xenobiotica]
MTIEVYTHEVLRMTVEELGDEEVIDNKDPENETEEHLAHVSRLLERDSTLSSRSRSLSRTPILYWEKEREGGWREEVEAYHALVAEGGRPSHPVTLGYDAADNPENYEQYKNILSFGILEAADITTNSAINSFTGGDSGKLKRRYGGLTFHETNFKSTKVTSERVRKI